MLFGGNIVGQWKEMTLKKFDIHLTFDKKRLIA